MCHPVYCCSHLWFYQKVALQCLFDLDIYDAKDELSKYKRAADNLELPAEVIKTYILMKIWGNRFSRAEQKLDDFKKNHKKIFCVVNCLYDELGIKGMNRKGLDKLSEFFDEELVKRACQIIHSCRKKNIGWDQAVLDSHGD